MPWTNASIVLNGRDRQNATAENYNNALFNAVNQNIIQGQIHSISLNEVNFPYDIPNIQKGPVWSAATAPAPPAVNPYGIYNSFILSGNIGGDLVTLDIAVEPGFYNGTELAEAINVAVVTENDAQGNPVADNADLPVCVYDPISNLFSFTLDAPATAGTSWLIESPYTFNTNLTASAQNTLGKDIMSIMGFLYHQSGGLSGVLEEGYPFVAGGSAPLAFTQYIDICSPQLCKGQRFRDGSTTNLSRRSDVICRLYISNNVATQEEEGARPFVISRQFNNARVMKWTTDNSVGTIDIQLYDDVGQPLLTTWQPRPYQITFNCYEQNTDDDAKMLSEQLKTFIGGAASYL